MKQSRRCRVRKHKRTLKRGNKKKMRGGLFTVERDKDEWAAVLEMMECKGASLSVISYRSLYGFILLLSIPEGTPSCAKFKDENGNLVYKIVLKIVLLGDEKMARLPSFIARNKSVMFKTGFEKEVDIQKRVFYETNAMNNKPITPGVACHKVYDTSLDHERKNAKTFLAKLSNLNNEPKGGWVSGKGITVEDAEWLIDKRVKVVDDNTNYYEADVIGYNVNHKLSNITTVANLPINLPDKDINLFHKEWFDGTKKWFYYDDETWVSGKNAAYYDANFLIGKKVEVWDGYTKYQADVIGYNVNHTLYNIKNRQELPINLFDKKWYYYDETIVIPIGENIKDTILVRVIDYITELSINHIEYTYYNSVFTNSYGVAGLGVIAMNYAGNYISDGTKYQIMTLYQMTYASNRKPFIDAKNKCFEYAIAQMLILSVKFKYINIDAHDSNFLTRFFQPGTREESVENIATWMIDMGRLKSIDDINKNATTYREKYNDLYKSIPEYNNNSGSPFDSHIYFISSFNIAELHSCDDKAIKSIHKLIRIIAALDYVINEKYRYKESDDRTPQCDFILKYLVGTSNISDMIRKKLTDIDIRDKYLRICGYITLITTKHMMHGDKMDVDDGATTEKTKRHLEVNDTNKTKKMKPADEVHALEKLSINF